MAVRASDGRVWIELSASVYAEIVARFKAAPRSVDSDVVRVELDPAFAPVFWGMARELAEACERNGPLAREVMCRVSELFPEAESASELHGFSPGGGSE